MDIFPIHAEPLQQHLLPFWLDQVLPNDILQPLLYDYVAEIYIITVTNIYSIVSFLLYVNSLILYLLTYHNLIST